MSNFSDFSTIYEMFYIAGAGLGPILFGYCSFWAFSIRRGLRVPSYRRQALGIGLACVYGISLLPLFYTWYIFYPSLSISGSYWIPSFYFAFLAPILLAIGDTSIRVGRKSDPLLRDSLRWNLIRRIIWPIMILTILLIAIGIYLPSENPLKMVYLDGIFYFIQLGLIVPVIASLVLSAKRSRDPYFRMSLAWFGLFLLMVVIVSAVDVILFTQNALSYGPTTATTLQLIWAIVGNAILVPLQAYFLYKCTKALVPLNRMPASDIAPRT